MNRSLFTLAIVGFAAMLSASTQAQSQGKVKVLADTPLRPALVEIAEAFRRDSGQQVDFVFGSSPIVLKRVADGETADVLIVQPNHQSVATVEALREVLLKADTLLFNTVVSGDQFAAVLERLGIAEAVKGKVVRLPPGPPIYQRVIQGKGNDIAAGVIPIIKETKGVRLIGPLPAELQTHQFYAAAPMTGAASPETAKGFIAFLASPAAKAAFAASGVE